MKIGTRTAVLLAAAHLAGLLAALGVLPGTAIASAEQATPASQIMTEAGTLNGLVWFDRNRDQVRNGDEPGAADTRVMVTNTATGEIFGATTDGTGSYVVGGLPEGRYQVTADNAGYLPTTREDVFVTVRAGSAAIANFGIDGGSISGLAWFDRNGDGVRQSFERRIRGVAVTVTGVRLASATTDRNGRYVVEDLPAGDHVLEFKRPWPGVGFTTPFVGDPARDSDVADTVQGLAFVPLGISTGGVADAEHIDAGYVRQ